MASVNPYLNFEGNCEEAFNFYKQVFGGEFTYLGRFKDMPPKEGIELRAEDRQKIMHISLPISSDTMLMGSDTGGEWAPQLKIGNNISLSINTKSKDEANRIFNSLADGGIITMPIASTFWGDYFGMCTDKFDISWMVSFNEGHPLKSEE